MPNSFLAQSSDRIPAIAAASVKIIQATTDEQTAAGVLTGVLGAFGVQTVTEVLQGVLVEAEQVYSLGALRERILPVLTAYQEAARRGGIPLPAMPAPVSTGQSAPTGLYL